jgi:membrane fusion protein, multidrug efflux system
METIGDSWQDHECSSERGRGLARLRPIASAAALVLLFVALPIGGFFGYLYRDYIIQLAVTDDSYMASRPVAVSELTGHMTAVPVTDIQHIVTGGVIGRLESSNDRARPI